MPAGGAETIALAGIFVSPEPSPLKVPLVVPPSVSPEASCVLPTAPVAIFSLVIAPSASLALVILPSAILAVVILASASLAAVIAASASAFPGIPVSPEPSPLKVPFVVPPSVRYLQHEESTETPKDSLVGLRKAFLNRTD